MKKMMKILTAAVICFFLAGSHYNVIAQDARNTEAVNDDDDDDGDWGLLGLAGLIGLLGLKKKDRDDRVPADRVR